jgi:CheY-like chemotaxis protein
MDADSTAKLLDAAPKLLGVLVWPAVIAYIFIRFGPKVGDFISSLGEVTLKGAGFEASAKRRQNEAAAALVAASASRPEAGATPEAVGNAAKEAVQIVGELSVRNLRRIEDSRILWVDDNPDNNIYERQSLEALGVRFVLSTSTDDALNKVRNQKFDAIISDMGRPPDRTAGYTLLDALRSSGDRTPFIIYAGSRSPEHQAESRRRGAVGCTNRANELFEMVLSVLQR